MCTCPQCNQSSIGVPPEDTTTARLSDDLVHGDIRKICSFRYQQQYCTYSTHLWLSVDKRTFLSVSSQLHQEKLIHANDNLYEMGAGPLSRL